MKNETIKLTTIWLIIITTFFILGLFRVIWTTYHTPTEQIQADNGVIDLTDLDLSNKDLVALVANGNFIRMNLFILINFKQEKPIKSMR